MDDLDTRLRAALAARAATVTEHELNPAEPPRARPRLARTAPWLAAAAVAAAVATTTVLATRPDAHRAAPPVGSPDRSGAVVSTVTIPATAESVTRPPVVLAESSAGPGTRGSTGTTAPTVCWFADASPCRVPAGYVWYQPLGPFATYRQVQAWRASGGSQPWHLDARLTAQAFVRAFGFTDLGLVTSASISADQAHIGIGYRDPAGRPHSAAVLHLVRYEQHPGDTGAPWEVVGTDDTTFSLETPSYGSAVPGTFRAGGHITGVDENIQAFTMDAAGHRSAAVCCVPAGGEHAPWSITVRAPAASTGSFAVVAWTGGHVQAHERFALQGVQRALK
ncbi:MAG: hypothetical protein ACTHMS_11155 [Jatrophihabitans sp.]|uniref:hypothetical protein n=1 Tax=Jatrophihabitans sp. TaxID=1932789 RepID=UPI003F7D9E13